MQEIPDGKSLAQITRSAWMLSTCDTRYERSGDPGASPRIDEKQFMVMILVLALTHPLHLVSGHSTGSDHPGVGEYLRRIYANQSDMYTYYTSKYMLTLAHFRRI